MPNGFQTKNIINIHVDVCGPTLQAVRRSAIAFLPILAATMTSSCLPEFPAATAFPVAVVMGFVALINSSG